MSNQDTGAAATPAAPASETSSISSEQQISLLLPAPAEIAVPAVAASSPITEAPKPAEAKVIEMPKPVEAAMEAAEAIKAAETAKAPVAPLEEPSIVPSVREVAEESRTNRFALLAASVAFAGALGAMAGALGTAVVSRGAANETPMAGVDLAPVRDAIASLRTEIGAIKSSVETSNRSANAQLAKFNERLERIDRAQAVPAAQLKQAMEAIERLEKRAAVQQSPATTGSVQQAAATPAAVPPAEAARARVIDGWTVRHVSRGVAVIQGRRMGLIEVEPGDIVPGVGRIESIRRQDGRWIVLTSNGMITSPTPR